MAKSYSDNAILAKVRALYGKRLCETDYGQLLGKRSVSEIAGYLKQETCYSEALGQVKEELVHREQLENMVRRRTLDIYLSLQKYSYNDNLFLTMHVMQNETRQLLFAMRLLNAGEMGRFIVSLPVYLARLMAFDLFAIARVKSYDDLLAIVDHTEYYPILARFRPLTSERLIDIPGCEAALLTYYYTKLLGVVEQRYRGATRDDLRRLLYYQIDLHNLSVIYRMKRYFRAPGDAVMPKLIPIGAIVPQKTIKALAECESLEALIGMLMTVRPLDRFRFDTNTPAEYVIAQTNRVMRWLHQKMFRFSIRPVVVVICYMTLLDIEVNNIVNIIEGARYNVPPDEIKSMLAL